jgi:hypothetical protein
MNQMHLEGYLRAKSLGEQLLLADGGAAAADSAG